MKHRDYKVVVIDSGIKADDSFLEVSICGKKIECQTNGDILISDNYDDMIGHGTAVVDCLLKEKALISQIYVVKIYEDAESYVCPDVLIAALDYVEKNIECDIVIISSGFVCAEKKSILQEVIDRITRKNIIVVAAYDNEGLMSYPAEFDSVIGVATNGVTGECPHVSETSKVDIVLQEKMYRLKWVNPSKVIIGGSSFAVPVVVAKITHILAKKEKLERVEKSSLLKDLAKELGIPYVKQTEKEHAFSILGGREFVKKVQKAIVFPWNKEINALVRYRDLLQFDIVGFYDVKYSPNVGHSIKKLLDVDKGDEVICNVDAIDWDGDFDTVICGHCTLIADATKRNFIEELAKKCGVHNKRLYAFDREAEQYQDICELYVPTVRKIDIPFNVGGRLYERCVPVVGVFGTSSKQGKYSVQLEMRKRFFKSGYHVAQLATEPSGYLFGADRVFPFGYNSNVDIGPEQTTLIVNHQINEIICDDTDVVIVGGQSGSVPFCFNNISQINYIGHGFLCGANPDVFILSVNPHDSIDYIENTIAYLQSFSGALVCSLVLFPVITEVSTTLGYGQVSSKLSNSEIEYFVQNIKDRTGVPVRVLGNEEDMDELFDSVIKELC